MAMPRLIQAGPQAQLGMLPAETRGFNENRIGCIRRSWTA